MGGCTEPSDCADPGAICNSGVCQCEQTDYYNGTECVTSKYLPSLLIHLFTHLIFQDNKSVVLFFHVNVYFILFYLFIYSFIVGKSRGLHP